VGERSRRINYAVEPLILERSQHPISRRDIDPNVLKILYRLANAGYAAYLVGGSVRDLMVGRAPKDFDVATSAHPQQVRELFRNSRLIGRRFRLVHVFFGPQNIEVATFRRRSEDCADAADPMIRHDNTFGTPEEDAFRRDFTVNALFYDPRTFEVIDYVGGVADLQARLIRTVGDPEVRIREDPVRMIRAVRFAVKMDFEIEDATRIAIERNSTDLAKASIPRVVEEIFRTLSVPGAARALLLMERLGLLEVLLPHLSAHLKRGGDAAPALDAAATVQNLAALGLLIGSGVETSRGLVMAALFADLHRSTPQRADGSSRTALLDDLRARGFSRVDTEQMRLLLEATAHLIARSRIARRLMRRPYYREARMLLELIAPTYSVDLAEIDRFLAEPPSHGGRYRGGRGASAEAATGANAGSGASSPPGPRRRRRRGGRRRRRSHAASSINQVTETTSAADTSSRARDSVALNPEWNLTAALAAWRSDDER
jgi:poly(A) polymerase